MECATSPKKIAKSLTEFWSPRVVAELDDSYVKIAKVLGTIGWHSHENEDELVFILKGQLKIEMIDTTVNLQEGDMYVVKKGIQHNPVAEQECHIMLIEKSTRFILAASLPKKRVL